MRVVLQRVKHASVHVDGRETGAIGQGFLILLGVSDTDDESIADKMADKICKLRIFEDENGKTNRSLQDVYKRQVQRRPGHFFRGMGLRLHGRQMCIRDRRSREVSVLLNRVP